MSVMVPDDAPRPRLCHVKKWADFQGYGFNLHAEKGKVGQFIGSVDDDSPAYFAGIKGGDRIVEVNGTNISNENHQQVVQRIKAVQNETKLLLVDDTTDEYYRSRKIVVRGDMPNVHRIEGPASRDGAQVENRESRSSSDSSNDSDAPRPRLCILRIWPDFQGYGFNLHAEKGKPGQFIGKVDPNSPAEAAGLREGDRIIEVNNDSVLDESHSEVVARVKATPNLVRMLVIEADGERFYREKGITITSRMPNVIVGEARDKSAVEAESAPVVAAAVHVEANQDDDDGPSPRLCILRIWPDFQGYGFNLHAEKGKPGQYIGNVDKGSPAEAAGLREGDRVVEINDENTQDKSHPEAVSIIKSKPGMVRILVVDSAGEKFYKVRGIVVNIHMRNVIVGEAEDRNRSERNSVSEIPSNAPRIRCCTLKKWADFQGYGFNLHAEKGKAGHFIGAVDPSSPAETAGVKEGDKIIAVNGDSILDAAHQQVVSKIKADPGSVRLLVLDPEAEEYYRSRDVIVTESTPNVDFISSPEVSPGSQVNGQVTHVEVNHSEVNVASSEHSSRSGRSTPEPQEVQVNGYDREEEVEAAAAVSASVLVEEIHVRAESPERLPTPVRDPSPEPVREPSPEPVAVAMVAAAALRDPSPERRSRASSKSSKSSKSRDSSPEPVREPSPEPVREPSPEPVRAPSPKPVKKRTSDDVSALLSKVDSQLSSTRISETKIITTSSSSASASAPAASSETPKPANVGGLEFGVSAKEMREKLSRKKKNDPRNASMNMRAKYDLYQNL